MKWMNPIKYKLKLHKNINHNNEKEYSLIAKEKNIEWGYRSTILFRYNSVKKILQIGKTRFLRTEFMIPILNIKVIKA